MLSIPGYELTEQLYASDRTLVFRGRRTDDNQPVVVKTAREPDPPLIDAARISAEYDISKDNIHEALVRVIALERDGHRPALVMADFGGQPLATTLAKQSLSPAAFLKLALPIAQGLQALHDRGVIHRDINPRNIIHNPKTDEIKLSDLSIATILGRETQRAVSTDALEGTLPYLSPEQTGRVSRPVDYRTDFYALGVTFYEMLCGEVPFPSDDPMTVIHAHLARTPRAPSVVRPEVPRIVSAVVMKLLAKTPEERYQSAAGLVSDLQRCRELLEANELAGYDEENFTPGERDFSGKFQLPERVYGRETESQRMGAVLARVSEGARHLVLLTGGAGVGKTALVQQLHGDVIGRGAWFIEGRFSEQRRDIPHAAFIEAVRGLVRQLLTEAETRVAGWRERLLETFAGEGQVLVEALPEIASLIGPQPPAPELPPPEAEMRFNRLSRNFFRVFAAAEHPLVIFLDDLQWADPASLRLVELLLADDALHHLLVIGAFRPELSADNDPLSIALERIEEGPAEVDLLALEPLDETTLAQLVIDATRAPPHEATGLAEVLRRKALGNPFSTRQFLRAVHSDGLLDYDEAELRWRWDLDAIEKRPVSDDVAELLLAAMQRLPKQTSRMLQLAAAIGVQFDLGTLSAISEGTVCEVVSALRPAVEEMIIEPLCQGFGRLLARQTGDDPISGCQVEEVSCQFSHSRFQQVAYGCIEQQERPRLHLKLGRTLHDRLSKQGAGEGLFELANHYNAAIDALTDPAERARAAQLNLEAGIKAKAAVAYDAAERYFEAGIALLPTGDERWQGCYELTFTLHAELCGCFLVARRELQRTVELAEAMQQNARSTTDRLRALAPMTVQMTRLRRGPEALQMCLDILQELGIDLQPPDVEVAAEQWHERLMSRLTGRRIADLVKLAPMVDAEKIATIELMRSAQFPMFLHRRDLLRLGALAMVELSLEHGNSALSGQAYATWGVHVAHGYGNFDVGYELAQLGKAVADAGGVYRASAHATAIVSCDWLREPLPAVLRQMRGAYRLGIETGDQLNAAICAAMLSSLGFNAGIPLDELVAECEPLVPFIESILGDVGVREIHLTLRFAATLQGKRPIQRALFEDEEQAAAALEVMHERNKEGALWYHLLTSRLSYLFGDFEQALLSAEAARPLVEDTVNYMAGYDLEYHQGLAAAAHCAELSDEEGERRQQLRSVVASKQAWLEDLAVGKACANFEHKYLLVTAVLAALDGDVSAAGPLFERAIAAAAASGLVHDQGQANEAAARFYQQQGLDRIATVYLKEARYCYDRWGASAKVAELEQRYPILHTPSQQTSLSGPIDISRTAIGSSTPSSLLDVATVLKASRAISREMVLSTLLQELLRIVAENAGAQRGFLVLQPSGALVIVAATDGSGASDYEPIDDSEQLPSGIVHYVARTQEAVVLEDAGRDGAFRTDPYVAQRRPRSVLCAPLTNQGNLVGVVYLENNLTSGAFTPDRLEVFNLLAAQAAISIENARLYNELTEYSRTLEQRVAERTRDLEAKNEEINASLKRQREMQDQLVISEKMASLGNLVAGVAHEINTPVGAVISATETSQGALKKLAEGVANATSIDELKNNPRVERLFALMADNLSLMVTAGDRVGEIVRTLRNFARLDEAELKAADLHEGIDSTLSLLHHRLKHGFEVVKEYGDLPKVQCYPNQINQVFMNLLVNAIDAIDHSDASRPNDRRITIKSWVAEQKAHIRITDTGSGVSDNIRGKIFDPGFTTKGVGVGTGLGLSICFNIISKHGGDITVSSNRGGAEFVVTLPLRQ